MDPLAASAVTDDEWLARYIVRTEHIRREDGSVKPDPFIPYSRVELSVTRHLSLGEADIWRHGLRVASELGRPLLGRADCITRRFRETGLDVISAPIDENQNHANVVGWPTDKPGQKALALEIARSVGPVKLYSEVA